MVAHLNYTDTRYYITPAQLHWLVILEAQNAVQALSADALCHCRTLSDAYLRKLRDIVHSAAS